MRLPNYLTQVTIYQIDRATDKALSSRFALMRPAERKGFINIFSEMLDKPGEHRSQFLTSIKNSENLLINMGVEVIFLKVKSFSETERLNIYTQCFPFFAVRIHLPEQAGSDLAITKKRVIQMTGFTERSVKSDLAKFRRAWPLSRNLVKTCLAQESALKFSDKIFDRVTVPWEQTGFYNIEDKAAADKTAKMLIAYLSGKVFLTAGLSAVNHGAVSLLKYISDVRKDMAMKFEWQMTSAKYPFDPKGKAMSHDD